MYRVAILGCENSHANGFLDAVNNRKIVSDIEFVGVYSDDRAAAEKLREQFGVPVMERYDELVGKVDGVMITARHGDNHLKYARPYLDSGIPMFIDKPITCTEEDARVLARELRERRIPVSGGSMCVFAPDVQKLKEVVRTQAHGSVLGGYLRAPVNMHNPYGDFFFYAQHLVQVAMEIFGFFPRAVRVVPRGDDCTCVLRYDHFDVVLSFVEGNYLYYAAVSCADAVVGGAYELDGCSDREVLEYRALFDAKEQCDLAQFFAPVYVLNAIRRAMDSGREEVVHAEEA